MGDDRGFNRSGAAVMQPQRAGIQAPQSSSLHFVRARVALSDAVVQAAMLCSSRSEYNRTSWLFSAVMVLGPVFMVGVWQTAQPAC